MVKNMSSTDRWIRLAIAVLLIWLNYTAVITGAWSTLAWIVVVIFVVTSAIGYCPMYQILKISTKK